MSILDVFKINKIKDELAQVTKERDSLKQSLKEIENLDYFQLKQAIQRLAVDKATKTQDFQIMQDNYNKKINEAEQKISALEKQILQKTEELIVIDEELLLESFALYKPKFKFLTSEEYKNRLMACRESQKMLIKNGNAVTINENWTVNNSKTEGKKMVNDMKKLMLRSFNNECDYCVDNVKFNNMEINEKRILKSFEELNRLGRIMSGEISNNYKKLKFDELYLAFEYHQKKQEEKEEQKRIREELREQQKLDQEIKQAREKIAKEKKHYSRAITTLEAKLNQVTSETEKNLILEKLDEMKEQCAELEKEEKLVDYRAQNAKAGYVYIISNIGSFGRDVYKIGMTRRLEPMDRVDELGDASVPFEFDVHALIFSDNAPALESKLHAHFHKNRINRLNNRKEFFTANLDEIEKVIRENYNKVFDIIKEAPAEQYRESLLLAQKNNEKSPPHMTGLFESMSGFAK